MKNLSVRLLLSSLLLAPCAVAQSDADLSAQLTRLMEWWPGEYDNHEQIVRQSGGGLSENVEKPFLRLHTVMRPLTAIALGEHLLLLTEYQHNRPVDQRRRRLLAVSVDKQARALRVTQWDTTQALDTAQPVDAATLKPLGPECDVLLHYVGGQFEGGTLPLSCHGPNGFWHVDFVIGPRYFWQREREMDRKGKVLSELAPGAGDAWYEESKARLFSCEVHENPDGIMAQTKYLTTIHLHDQGGEADIAWPDGRTLTFTIHERAFTSPPDREYPLFRVHEKGKTVPIAYAYAVDGASRFGLNLGWFYIRCYAEGDSSSVEDRMRPKAR